MTSLNVFISSASTYLYDSKVAWRFRDKQLWLFSRLRWSKSVFDILLTWLEVSGYILYYQTNFCQYSKISVVRRNLQTWSTCWPWRLLVIEFNKSYKIGFSLHNNTTWLCNILEQYKATVPKMIKRLKVNNKLKVLTHCGTLYSVQYII